MVDKSPALLKLTGLNKAALTTQISDHRRAIKKGRAGRRMEGTGVGCSLLGAQRQYGWAEGRRSIILVKSILQALWEPYLQSSRGTEVTSEPPVTPGTSPAFLAKAAHLLPVPHNDQGLNTGKRLQSGVRETIQGTGLSMTAGKKG